MEQLLAVLAAQVVSAALIALVTKLISRYAYRPVH